jgi:hypothetical protein
VGREDTGELEAQVRGSRHAWDIRLISADALVKLTQLKENTEGTETGRKIRSLLTPMEYTRLDQMIDVMFTTAKDVEQTTVTADVEESEDEAEAEAGAMPLAATLPKAEKGTWQFTDSGLLQEKRTEIVAALGKQTGTTFIKKSRALAWDAGHTKRLVSTISKRYLGSPTVSLLVRLPSTMAHLSAGREGSASCPGLHGFVLRLCAARRPHDIHPRRPEYHRKRRRVLLSPQDRRVEARSLFS